MTPRATLAWLLGAQASIAIACAGAKYEGGSEGPSLRMPHRFAEGSEKRGERGDGDAGGDARQLIGAWERSPARGSQPDPEALRELRHFEYEIVYDHGKLRIASVRAVRFTRPVPTARRMGRFALELWIGKELVERVRFDFPLVAAEDVRRTKKRPLDEPPSFAAGVVASQKVLVPASPRATRAFLVDRATGDKQELPWPPDAPLGPPRDALPVAPDGGPDSESAGADAGPKPEAGPAP